MNKLVRRNFNVIIMILMLSFVFFKQATALEYSNTVSVGFTFNETLSLSVSGDIVIDNLTVGNSKDSNSVSVVVNTNASLGYTLSASVGNSSNNTTNLVGSGSGYFSSIGTDASLSSLTTDNTWGYSISSNGTSWGNYSGLGIYSGDYTVLKDTNTKPTGGSETTYFKIGAKAGASLTAGDYSNVITFYAVGKVPEEEPESLCGSTLAMQDITSAYVSTMTTNTQVQMCDVRDGKIYWVAKLADGNVWMTQNLDLVLSTDTTLTPNDSDVSANWTPNSNTQTTQYDGLGSSALWNSDYNTTAHSYRPASDSNAGTSGDFGNDGDTYYSPVIMINGTTMSSYKSEAECVAGGYSAENCAHWNVGTYYSWYAATAGTGNASVSTVTNVSDSICPKGWHLPSSTSSGEFQALITAGSITASTITGSPYYFLRSGHYNGDYGAVYNTGGDGGYWSSTSGSNSSYAYVLLFSSSNVSPSDANGRCSGFSVRCVAGS